MGSLLNDKLVGVDEIPVVPSAQPELVRADFAPGKDFCVNGRFALDFLRVERSLPRVRRGTSSLQFNNKCDSMKVSRLRWRLQISDG